MRKSLLLTILAIFVTTFAFSINASWNYTVTTAASSPMTLTAPITLGGGGDDIGYSLQWPFAFQVYDDIYTTSNSISMTSNGYFRFDNTLALTARSTVIPTANAQFGQFLSYGGDLDGYISGNVVYQITGSAPNRILTFAFTYYTHYSLGNAYHADIQISFNEANHNIIVNYSNVAGTIYQADYLGMNAGDGIFGPNYGLFPTSGIQVTYTPGSAINPPAAFSATVASSCQNNLTWQKNTTNNDVIIVYSTSPITSAPANGSSYAVNGSIGSATVLYSGSATSYNHTALPSNTHYYYKIWSKSGSNIYSTTGLSDDETTNAVTAPGALYATNVTSSQIDLAWSLNGFGDNVILTYNTVNSFVNPTNGTVYNVNDQIGGQQTVLYKGSLLAFQHSGLTLNNTYHYKLWSYGCQNDYSTTGQTLTQPTSGVQNPTLTAQNISSTCENSLSWTKNGNGDNVIILANTSAITATPSNGTTYAVNDVISGSKVIYTGAATSFTHSGLIDGTTYYYKAYSYNSTPTYSPGVTANATTATISNPSSLTATAVSSSQIDLSWGTVPTGMQVMVAFLTPSGTFANPVDGNSYAVGNPVASGPGTVIYKGTGTSFSHTGLSATTAYLYKIWYVDCGNNYSGIGATANANTLSISIPNPTTFTATASGTCQINLSWTPSGGNNVMVVMNTSNAFTAPTNSTAYVVGYKFANGDSVIYKGSASSYNVSSLKDNTPYYFKAYSYNSTPYYSTGALANAQTTTISNPSTLTATAASTTQINLTWNALPAGMQVMVAYISPSGSFANPADGTSYTVGSQIASGQGTVIYKGSATGFNHTGLAINTPYYYKVWYYDCGLNYSSTGATANTNTNGIDNPITFDVINTSSCRDSIFWQKNASGDDVVVVFNYINSFATPVNGFSFIPTPGQTIYFGGANYFIHTPLYSGLKYYYKIYSRTAGTYNYSSGILDSVTTSVVPNTTNFAAVSGGPTQINLTWTKNSQNDNVIIAYNTVNSFGTPSTGYTYVVNSQIAPSQGIVIYNGPLSLFNHSSLSLNTPYFYKVWSYDCGLNYSSGQTANATTSSVSAPQSFTATGVSASQIDLSWVKNLAGNDIMVAYNTTDTFANPVNGQDYPNLNQIVTGYGTVLYTGPATSFNHTGLNMNTVYYYKVWSKDGSKNYSSGIKANDTTLGVTNPIAFDATMASSSQINLTWTKNISNDNVMVVFNTVNDFAALTNGFNYVVNNQIATNQGTVIYKGPAAAFNHTGLSASTKYYYKAYSYNAAYYYSTPGLLDSATTDAPGISTFPYLETFDTQVPNQTNIYNCVTYYPLTSGWNNVQTVDDIDWVVRQGTTPNGTYGQTGPANDHTTGAGNYLYTEASACYNKAAWLVSPLFNFSSLSNPKMEFYYFMLGNGTGSINVQISTNGGTTWSTTNLFNLSGQQQTVQTAPWGRAEVNLSAYAGMSNIRLRIKGTTGFNYLGDMAIDDVRVYQPQNMTVSSIITEQDTINVVLGSANQQVIRVKITTVGAFSPMTLGQLGLNTTGTTATSDITAARVFYTANIPTFNTTQQFGTAITNPNGSFPITGSQVLAEGDNYFWVTYDIASTATIGNKVDAQCVTAIIAGITNTPTITNPTGDKTIIGQVIVGTGTASNYNGPLYPPFYHGAHESIYLASELGTGAKEINKIAWHKASGSNIIDKHDLVTIYLKNSTVSTLSGALSLTGYTQVYSGIVPNNLITGWIDVNLTNTFLWDGTSNIHVLVVQNKPAVSWNNYPYWSYTTVTPNKARGGYDYNAPVTNLISTNQRPNIRFEYVWPLSMSYSSSTVTQPNTSNVEKGTNNTEIIAVKVETSNTANPLTLTKLLLSTAGTSSASDIANAKIYYTGTSSTFSATNQFGSTVANPSGSYSVSGSQALQSGTNYFWVAYDVSATAIPDNILDATCDSITVSGTKYKPTVTNPNGGRAIKQYLIIGTGTNTDYLQPLHVYYYHAWEGVYTAAQMGTAKDLSALAFYKQSGSNTTNQILNVKIYLKHTTDGSLASGAYSTTVYQQVYQGNFPNNAPSGWMEVQFDNNFAYNGTQNLEVLVVQSYGLSFTGYPYWAYTTTTNNQARWANSYSTPPTNLTAQNRLANVRFEYSDPSAMSYASSAVTQNNTSNITAGLPDQNVIGVEVVTNNSSNPLSATSFTFNTTGSSSPAGDITNAKVYYTGTSNTFSAINQFGSTTSNPNGTFTITGNQTLSSGTNYFWLTYDIPATATTGHWVDAECTALTVGAVPRTPSPTTVIGNRTIIGALSGEYTIGAGGDYTSFTSAINALNNYGVAGWVKFRVFSGTYNEQVVLSPYANSSTANTVTFESYTGDSSAAIITYTSSGTANNYTMQISGASNYIIRKLTIKNTGTNYGTPLVISGSSSNILISNNRIINGTGTNMYSSAIYAYNNVMNNVRITKNNIGQTGSYGIYLRGPNTTSQNINLVVDSNIITATQYPAYLMYNNAVKFHDNSITANGSNYAYCIYSYYCDNGSEFYNNKISTNATQTAYGIFMGYSTASASVRNKIYNNFISILSTSITSGYGIYNNGNTYTDIVHNNISFAGSNGNNRAAVYYTNGSENRLQNNMFVATNGGRIIYLSSTSAVSSSNYNNFYTTGTTLGYYGTLSAPSLAAWRTYSSMDMNSIATNPQFISTTNLHVTNVALNNLGSPYSGITTDIDGDLRHATTPDMGADEFSVDIDGGVSAINSPITGCNTNQSVQVVFKNFGQTTLTTAIIDWQLDGVLQSPFNWLGSISTSQTANVTLGNNTFTAGNHIIKAWSSNPNGLSDQLTSNDTMTVNFTISAAPIINAGVDATICATGTHTTSALGSGYSSIIWSTSGTGTFAGGTTLTATYTPSAADVTAGSVYLKISALSAGCGAISDSLLLTIQAMPVVSFSGLAATYCASASPVTLTGVPAGGVFSGPGISGNTFNPAIAGTGLKSIKYVYTLGTCKDSSIQTTTVSPTLTPTITGLATGYCLTSPASTLTGTPAGGVWSGAITSNVFNPAVVGIGIKSITYTVTDVATSCSFDTTYITEVYSVPVASISGLSASYCDNEPSVALTGSPIGGTFAGAGISGNIFSPSIAGVGTHTIEYQVNNGVGCGDTAYQVVNVLPAPIAMFSGLGNQYCSTASPVLLSGTPTGGSFSGSGITGNQFSPSTAATGVNWITYTFTGSNGCIDTSMRKTTVNQTPVASAGPDLTIVNGADTILYGSASGGSGSYSYSWSPSNKLQVGNATMQNPNTLNLTASEIFTVIVTDNISGCSSSDQMTVTTTSTVFGVTASGNPLVICAGDSSQIQALASGGAAGNYNYLWSSSPSGYTSAFSSDFVSPTVTTTYTVIATDGISFASASVIVQVNPLPIVTLTGLSSTYCSNADPITMIGSPAGGIFSGTGVSGNKFSPASAGSGNHIITYQYTNTNGCSNIASTNVMVYASPIAEAGATATINYNTDTLLYGSATNGGNYLWSWSPSSKLVTTNTAVVSTTSLTAAQWYQLTVTDSLTGCYSNDSVLINIIGGPLSAVASASTSSVCSGSSANLSVLPSGGTGSYNYLWSSSPAGFTSTQQNPTVTPLVTTTYTVVVNSGSQNVTDNVVITVNPIPTVSFTGLNNTYCLSDAATNLLGSPVGGVFSGNGVTGNDFDPATAGVGQHFITYTYSAPITGCSAYKIDTTYVYALPIANAGIDITLTAPGATTLNGSASAGSGNYSYSWSPAAMVISPTASTTFTTILTSTTLFTLNVNDLTSGCADSDDMIVIVGTGTLSATAIASPDTICAGNATTITALPSGGSSSYTYSWSSNPAGFASTQMSQSVSPSVTTTYTVTVNDGTNTTFASVVVTVNPIPSVSFTGLNTTYCTNNSISLLTGIPAGGTFSGQGISGSSFDPSTLVQGSYNITYNYSDPNTGCSNSQIQSTSIYEGPVANAGLDVNILAGNDTILYGSAVGGGNYIWGWSPTLMLIDASLQNPQTVILSATQLFTLTVTDSLTGCSDNDDVIVYAGNTSLNATINASNSVICSGDSVQLTVLASGGTMSYTYSWTSIPAGFVSSSFAPMVKPTVTTLYSVQVFDGVNYVTKNITITVNPKPGVALVGLSASTCEGSSPDTLMGFPAGGVYSGVGVSSNLFSPIVAGIGTHYVSYSFTDINGCSNTDVDTIVINAKPIANAGSDAIINVNNDTILYGSGLGGSGNYSYEWSPASELLNAFAQNATTKILNLTTNFTLKLTDQTTGCFDLDTVKITVKGGALVANPIGNPDTICYGNSTQLDAFVSGGSGNYTYLWSSNPSGFSSSIINPTVSPAVTTTFTVIVDDGVGIAVNSIVIVVETKPIVQIASYNATNCNNGGFDTLVGSPSGGIFFGNGISGNLFNPSIAGVGTHQIIYSYTTAGGCNNSDTISTQVITSPVANAGNDILIPCGGSGGLIGSNPLFGLVYNWSPSTGLNNPNSANTVANPNVGTNYTLTVSDTLTGCSSSDNVLVDIIGGPNALVTNDTIICKGESLTISASGGTSFAWNNGVGTSSFTISPNATTTYIVTVTDGACSDVDSVTVYVNAPYLNLGPNVVLIDTTTFVLDAGYGFIQYLWNTGDTVQSINVLPYVNANLGYNTFGVAVMDAYGCIAIDSVSVTYVLTIDEFGDEISLNIYPNPSNGVFNIEINGTIGQDFKLEVMNLTGQIVHSDVLNVSKSTFTKEFDFSTLAKGVYLLKVSNDSKANNYKLIIQ